MTQKPSKNSTVIWQEATEDEGGLPEPAILIEAYYGTVSISQSGDSVLLNYESLEQVIKTLRAYAKQAKEGTLK